MACGCCGQKYRGVARRRSSSPLSTPRRVSIRHYSAKARRAKAAAQAEPAPAEPPKENEQHGETES